MRILRYLCLVVLFGYSTAVSASSHQVSQSQKILANQVMLYMLKSVLPPEIVAAKIKSSHCSFNTDVPTLKELKDKGVPDSVVLAMVEAPHFAVAPSDGKIRVFVTDSQSWEVRGGWAAANGSGGGTEAG